MTRQEVRQAAAMMLIFALSGLDCQDWRVLLAVSAGIIAGAAWLAFG